ncbi:MAG: ArsR family transcriptional regulator [Promethearchaeota archaeon CR_4]|nr:MAG: ArsR family transcriptional regulator [Candidatus Lokiarchaeota archaeon CR_4]
MPDEKIARALRARVRRDILHLLGENNNRSVKELANILHITESRASKHLKFLYDMGLVDIQNDPPKKFYFLKFTEIKDLVVIYDKIVEKMEK